jgi:hypothetical protein
MVPAVPVAVPASIERLPEFEVVPVALPDLIVNPLELVLAVDVSAVLTAPLSIRSLKLAEFDPRSIVADPGRREVLIATLLRLDKDTLAPPPEPPRQF